MKPACCAGQLLARTIHDGSWRNCGVERAFLVKRISRRPSFVKREAYLASRKINACERRDTKDERRIRATRDERRFTRKSGESAITAEAFVNHAGKNLQKTARACDHSRRSTCTKVHGANG